MKLTDLAALEAAPLQRDPFNFLVVPDFLSPEAQELINPDYPQIQLPRNFALDEISYGPHFSQLLDELNAPEFADAIASKFGVNLDGTTTSITVRKYCEASDGNIHLDHWSKIITVLVYFNAKTWDHEGGMLRMLRSSKDIEDYAAEVEPLGGTLLAFHRSNRSWHGHKQFVGERRMLQMNFIKSNLFASAMQRLARFSTHSVKRLQRIGQ